MAAVLILPGHSQLAFHLLPEAQHEDAEEDGDGKASHDGAGDESALDTGGNLLTGSVVIIGLVVVVVVDSVIVAVEEVVRVAALQFILQAKVGDGDPGGCLNTRCYKGN